MNTRYYILLASFVIALAGCEAPVDVTKDAYEEKLFVIGGIYGIGDSSNAGVRVSKTLPYGEVYPRRADSSVIEDALVHLSIGDSVYKLKYDPGHQRYYFPEWFTYTTQNATLSVSYRDLEVRATIPALPAWPEITRLELDTTNESLATLWLHLPLDDVGIAWHIEAFLTDGTVRLSKTYTTDPLNKRYRSALIHSTNPGSKVGLPVSPGVIHRGDVLKIGYVIYNDIFTLLNHVHDEQMGRNIPPYMEGVEPEHIQYGYNVTGDGMGYVYRIIDMPAVSLVVE